MKFNCDDFLHIQEDNSEERELINLSRINLDQCLKIDELKEGNQEYHYDELTAKIRSLIYNYILDNQNTICSPNHKFLNLFYDLYNRLLQKSFMNEKFLMNFLYKRILLFYDSIHPKDSNVMIINDGILNLCKDEISPILIHCLNIVVNKFIFESNLTDYEYLLKLFLDKFTPCLDFNEIGKKTAEIFFIQLICLDDYKNPKDKLTNFNDEKVAKKFIENQIINYHKINNYLNKNKEKNDDINSENFEYKDKPMISLFKNDFIKSNIHLLRYLKNAIINVFTPYDSNILNYFQTTIYKFVMEKASHINNNKNKNNLKLDLLGKLFLNCNIQDADIKIRNISFLIDIILQKYFNIQNIPELDLLKFPRINIAINRLFIEKTTFHEEDMREVVNGIFEHFIISQFIRNYIEYQVKDAEHYPLEIRYFVIYSYIKISEPFLISNNPFSAYITSITLREMIKYLHLEKGFKKQKYLKNANLNISNNSINQGITTNNVNNKNSTKKTKRRKSNSRSNRKKKKNKKKSLQKGNSLQKNNIVDTSMLESYITLENDPNIESKNSNEKIIFGDDDKLDEPQKLISKTLFNYLCFIYSMKTKYSNYYIYFEELYSFIDDYISQNINVCNLDKEWTWLLIHQTKYIKKFNLDKTFEKFKFKSIKNTLDSNMKLVAYLSKKVKYCNTQEHYLILDIIYNILINIDNLDFVLKSQKYSENFKKLNRALSYLSFNINFSFNFSRNMPLINQEFVGELLLKITNLLFIESIDEYFWIPKNLKGYKNFNEFITILEALFNKVLYKQSLYCETFLYGEIELKKYKNKFTPNKNISKKDKEKEQHLLALDYFSKLKIIEESNIRDLRKFSRTKENIIKLMELMPEEYDMEYDLNEKCHLFRSILLSGEYDLIICLFLIIQLITKEKFKEDSNEIKLINEIFESMINKDYKFVINFLLTIYKSIEKYIYDLIDNYVQKNFPESYTVAKKDYSKFIEIFENKNIDSNNKDGKDMQIIYYNWNLIKENLENTGVLYKFLYRAEEINYPKSVMNIIEKYIFDIMRKNNIHNFSLNDDNNKYLIKYLKLYYKAYSHIDDNKMILDNYFNSNQILLLITKNDATDNPNYKLNIDINSSNNLSSLNDFINNINQYLIELDTNILINNKDLVKKLEDKKNKENIYFTITRLLYNIIVLNDENFEMIERISILTMLDTIKRIAILNVLTYNNKYNESNSSINYSLFLYEFILYLEQFKILFKKNNNTNYIDKSLLCKKLKNILIEKRKIPHLKRYLLVFEFRRFIFNLYKDSISELYCLMDICKVYKSIWETGISTDEICSFRNFVHIYLNNLLSIDDNLLINIDKRLFLVPLKYYVKYFALENFPPFDSVFVKYKRLCLKNQDLLTNKILILQEKLKLKTGVVGMNEILLTKIKKLGKKSSANNKEGFLLYTDFYLEQLLSDESIFNNLKPDKYINNIKIYDVNPKVYDYLEGAINICIITDKEKYLRKYMPEIINLFFKLNFAVANYNQDNNINNNISQTQTQSLIDENINKFIFLLNKFKNDLSINKVKIIIPQLIICYQYDNTLLYNFAIELLTSYAEKNIDLIAYLLSSFLNFKIGDLKNIGLKTYRGGDSHNNKYNNYANTFNRSKNFVSIIKNKLSEKNQSILVGYEEFCQKLSYLFFEFKKSSSIRKDLDDKQIKLIKEINEILSNNKIILPTIENISKYKSEIRNNVKNNLINDIFFLKELDSKIEVLSSKERPLHIRFKITNIDGSLESKEFYDFLLKCDVNDITKEIKTFEIIDEINNIFRIKHYDINDSMSLKRYLIVPIAPTIILGEWLSNSISLSTIIEEQSKKDLIYQKENNTIIKLDNDHHAYIISGSIINLHEKFNILYNYYQYNFFDPNLWYKAKKKYIISTAIWSMTSFLVGLGDRHLGNIMANKENGEIIHIDFGYVALKGLSLGVPEIVDFRFTINVRKNLGLFEENGLFNYICVKTLKTFKEYYKTLSARIEYYQFDPLFDTENDNQTFNLYRQNDNFFRYLDDKNVKDKLKKLIIKNSNSENLEKMYVWWSPWV